MHRQNGFTLIEMAIVLVIVGLLLGGALKGQALIESARIKNVIQESNAHIAAIHSYKDRYQQLPGDDTGAVAARGANWNEMAAGDGNGKVGDGKEQLGLWQHLRAAGFISGSSVNEPQHALGGKITAKHAALGFGSLTICMDGVSGDAALAIENQIDNGKGNSGSLRAIEQTAENITIPTDASNLANEYSTDKTYTLCRSV